MQKNTIEQERLKDKMSLFQKVSYVCSILSIIFCFVCLFVLNVRQIIPYALLAFGILNGINTYFLKSHKSLSLSYNISTVLAMLSALVVTLYSGGINSPFIFALALILFAAYVSTRRYGQTYVNLFFLLVVLIYSQSLPEFSFTYNVVPEDSKNLFGLCSILFAFYILGNVFGRTLRKKQSNLYRFNQELKAQIDEKDTMFKEIHHRVKNNLQTVSSLLSLQSRNIEDDAVKAMLKSNQNRVLSMAMIHEMLYMRDDYLSKVAYKPYVQELSEYLIKSVKGSTNNVKLTIDIPDIKLGVDTAIPLGLLINEALTNSLKYGIEGDDGEINIALKKQDEKDYILSIGDNGVGFPDNVDHKTTKSLGLKLIHNLARQLKGSIVRDFSKKGTNYIVKFQEIGQQLHPVV